MRENKIFFNWLGCLVKILVQLSACSLFSILMRKQPSQLTISEGTMRKGIKI